MDEHETPVLFRKSPKWDGGEIVAVFPTLPESGYSMTCYAHVGQHSACTQAWYVTTKAAKPEEYADLKRELESGPYGYRLRVYKRMTRQHREAFLSAIHERQRPVAHATDKQED